MRWTWMISALATGGATAALVGTAGAQLPVPLPGMSTTTTTGTTTMPPSSSTTATTPPPLPDPPASDPGAPTSAGGLTGIDASRRNWLGDASIKPPFRALFHRDYPARVRGVVVGGGRAYLTTGTAVVALELASGRELWRATTGAFTQLAFGGGVLVVSGDKLKGLDAATGAELWSKDFSLSGADPLIAGDVVVVQGQGLSAYDLASGALRWRGGSSDGTEGAPAAAGDRVYQSGGCHVTASDRRDGHVIWSRSSSCSSGGGGDRVVVSGDKVLTPLLGRPLAATDGSDAPGPLAQVVVGAVGLRGYEKSFEQGYGSGYEAVDLGSGKVLWRTAPPGNAITPFTLPLGVADNVLFVRSGGPLVARSAQTGNVQWGVSLPPFASRFTGSSSDDASELTAGDGAVVVTRGATIDAFAGGAKAGVGRLTLPHTAYGAEALGGVKLAGKATTGGGLPGLLRLEADPYPFDELAPASVTGPIAKGAFALTYVPDRNTRLRVVDTTGAATPSRTVTVYAYPRIRFKVKNAANLVTASISVKGSSAVRFRGRTVVLYVGRASARTFVRLGAGKLTGPATRSASGTVRFRALSNVGRKDFLFACVPGVERLGQGFADAVQKGCGRGSLKF